jgi:hypothetical protein
MKIKLILAFILIAIIALCILPIFILQLNRAGIESEELLNSIESKTENIESILSSLSNEDKTKDDDQFLGLTETSSLSSITTVVDKLNLSYEYEDDNNTDEGTPIISLNF